MFCLNWSQCHGLINYPYNTKWSERHCPFRLRTHPWACFIDGQIFDLPLREGFAVKRPNFRERGRVCLNVHLLQCLNVRLCESQSALSDFSKEKAEYCGNEY